MRHWKHHSFRYSSSSAIGGGVTNNRRAKGRAGPSSNQGQTLIRTVTLFLTTFLAGQSYVSYRSSNRVTFAGTDDARIRGHYQVVPSNHSAGPDLLKRHETNQEVVRRQAAAAATAPAPTPDPFPPLSSLVDLVGDHNSNVRPDADLGFLLDFAIIGFAKSGTTTLSRYLRALGVSILPEECCYMVVNKTAKLVRFIYQALPHDMSPTRMPRGLKCPQDMSSDLSLPNYQRFFGRTKLIIGIRSPISFFQSFYNFRAVNTPWKDLLPTQKLAKRCIPGSLGICGWRASFVDFLYKLGKTPGGVEEHKLLELHLDRVDKVGDVFLYELGQLADTNTTRTRQFRQDLGKFLGLQGEMPPIPHVNTLGRFDYIDVWKEEVHQRKIDICDEEHTFARSILQDKTERTSKWLREHFLKSTEVTVSSREYFIGILQAWMNDPCRSR